MSFAERSDRKSRSADFARHSAFRFIALQDPAIHKLSVNYRTHNGILGAASQIVSLLISLFPSSVDQVAGIAPPNAQRECVCRAGLPAVTWGHFWADKCCHCAALMLVKCWADAALTWRCAELTS